MSYMEIRNLKKVYNPYGMHPKVALNGLDFKVEKGDFICIMGASGSGKTTLVNILSTIDEATGGQILLNQKDLLLLSEKEKAKLRKEEIGFIFQNYNLIESLTIKNNISCSILCNGIISRQIINFLRWCFSNYYYLGIYTFHPFFWNFTTTSSMMRCKYNIRFW